MKINFDNGKAMRLMVFILIRRGLSAWEKIEGGDLNIPERIDIITIGVLP